MSPREIVQVKDFLEWNIDIVDLRKKDHQRFWFQIDGHTCCNFCLFVESYSPKFMKESYLVFWLLTDDCSIHKCSIFPLYYTVSAVGRNGQNVLARKGIVSEQSTDKYISSTEQVCIRNKILLGNLAEDCLKDNNFIQFGYLTVRCIFKPNWNEAKLPTDTNAVKLLESLSSDFSSIYNSKQNSDCILKVQGARISAHSSILAARSKFFATLFDGKENGINEYEVEDVDMDVLIDVLEYIYSGKVKEITSLTAFKMFKAANKLELQELKAECCKFIKKNLKLENFCEAAILANTHGETELEDLIVIFIDTEFDEIIKNVVWHKFLKSEHSLASRLLTAAYAYSKRKQRKQLKY